MRDRIAGALAAILILAACAAARDDYEARIADLEARAEAAEDRLDEAEYRVLLLEYHLFGAPQVAEGWPR